MALSKIDIENMVTGELTTTNGGTGATSFTAGITHAELFRLTSSVTGEADPITGFQTTSGVDGQGRIGTGMSESSGVFTFPTTGIYRIEFTAFYYRGQADDQVRILIKDNASNELAKSIQSVANTNYFGHNYTSCMLDVTDVTANSNKVTFEFEDVGPSGDSGSAKLQGTTDNNASHVVFTRLGDT
jgi:hypothetical protein